MIAFSTGPTAAVEDGLNVMREGKDQWKEGRGIKFNEGKIMEREGQPDYCIII